jgi:hypothetical protein
MFSYAYFDYNVNVIDTAMELAVKIDKRAQG